MLLPNILTFVRVLIVPLIIWAFFSLSHPYNFYWSASLFLLAAITDWLDGYLARSLKQTSQFGAFLDPVADKLLVMAAGLLIVQHYHSWWITVPIIVIIGREITISALREWMASLGKAVAVKVLYIARVKTAMQLISLAILLAVGKRGLGYNIGLVCLYISTLLTLYSMYAYLKISKSDLTNSLKSQ